MEIEQRLERAKDHLFPLGLNDSGAKIAASVMTFGLAKIHYLQEALGYRPNAFFLSAPDFTITRNTYRFGHGIGYGGILSWGNGKDKWIPLDIKPNACGMLIGGIDEIKSCEQLIKALEELKNDPGEIEGTNIKWDFNKSNHFINLFKVKDNQELPPYVFVIHGAGDEFRSDNQNQFGLYIDKSQILKSLAHTLETPFGEINYLSDELAEEYLNFYLAVEEFTKQRRRYVAHQLFGKFSLISDQNHQGLIGINQMVLGCHKFYDTETIYPLMLRADLPAYLLQGKNNLTSEQINRLGFKERARKLEIYDQLHKINILPHGGGYHFPDILDVGKTWQLSGNIYYELLTTSGIGKKIVQHVREIPYEYRGQEVLSRTLDLDLAKLYATLIPQFTLKI